MTWDEAWTEFGRYAIGNVRRRTWEHLSQDEIQQTARVAVWEALRRFPDGPDRRYVIRCAGLMAIDELVKAGVLRERHGGKHYTLPTWESLDVPVDEDSDVLCVEAIPAVVDVEETVTLWDAFSRLPIRQALAILARDLWGYTPQEARSLTDVADITHRRDRAKGLRTLREALA